LLTRRLRSVPGLPQTQKCPLSLTQTNGPFFFFPRSLALNAETTSLINHRRKLNCAIKPLASTPLSISPASGLSSAILDRLARNNRMRPLGESSQFARPHLDPCHAHSSHNPIVFRKFTSMRPSRRAPLIPSETDLRLPLVEMDRRMRRCPTLCFRLSAPPAVTTCAIINNPS